LRQFRFPLFSGTVSGPRNKDQMRRRAGLVAELPLSSSRSGPSGFERCRSKGTAMALGIARSVCSVGGGCTYA
jgi:hypothetical protein